MLKVEFIPKAGLKLCEEARSVHVFVVSKPRFENEPAYETQPHEVPRKGGLDPGVLNLDDDLRAIQEFGTMGLGDGGRPHGLGFDAEEKLIERRSEFSVNHFLNPIKLHRGNLIP